MPDPTDKSWKKLIAPFGTPPEKNSNFFDAKCPNCSITYNIKAANFLRRKNEKYFGWCRKCVQNTPEVLEVMSKAQMGKSHPISEETKQKLSKITKEKWKDPKIREMYRSAHEKLTNDPEWKRKSEEGRIRSQSKRTETLKKVMKTYTPILSEASKKKWQDPKFREKVMDSFTEERRERISESMKKLIEENKEFREHMSKMAKLAWTRDDYRKFRVQKSQESSKKMWESPEYRQKRKDYWTDERRKLAGEKQIKIASDPIHNSLMSELTKKQWENPEYREYVENLWKDENRRKVWSERGKKFNAQNPRTHSKQSSLEAIFEYVLKEYEINFIPEFISGPYAFDFFLPDHQIFVEIQGLKWHHPLYVPNPIKQQHDVAKATYVKRHTECELWEVWEDHMNTIGYLRDSIKGKLGIQTCQIDFDFDNIIIKEIDKREANNFFQLFHYKEYGRNGHEIGAFFNNKLIAVAEYSHCMRQESTFETGFNYNEVHELSRFCIHERYQKKNFASWFIAKSRNFHREKYPYIMALISFADSTYGHNGIIYKASGWEFKKVIDPDYYYLHKESGRIIHKRTLWRHSSKLRILESEFAKNHGYEKVLTKEKYKYIYYFPLPKIVS